ncbi:uncharacterized protein LOC121425869 [Lytechinus variegatus]|uniref:uncharacterized protein LOC121425869 n=1 Tax=Lytechinus variegatus TaxID=7654 RepID=UPI001BB1E85F|nr:uncharacterized protein LOC121425869 [Lytechinus variegatus]
MTSEFSSIVEGAVCEEAHCESITDVTFYVKEKKKLCHDCALKKECIGIVRRGEPNLFCQEHNESIRLYCRTHNVALCYPCALTDHRQQQCVHEDIMIALKKNREDLSILKNRAIDKSEICRIYGNEIHKTRQAKDQHLQGIQNDVDSEIENEIERETAREREDADKIDKEIDGENEQLQEEIRKLQDKIEKNNEKREKRHEENRLNAEKRRQPITDKQHIMHADIQKIAQEIERKIGELEKSWQDDTKSAEKAKETLDRILEDDKNIVIDGHRVSASVSEELKKQLKEGEVKEINRVVSGVRFVKGVGREKYDGRIDGYDGEWKLIDTINVTDKIMYPWIVGCIDEDKVMITEARIDKGDTYMLNLNSKTTQGVINGSDTSYIISCAVLNDDKIVCGRYIKGCTGDSLPGCISVYDRQWNHISDVTIPTKTTNNDAGLHLGLRVAIDHDGMIIAAEWGQSAIYVINPANDEIVNTITCKEKIVMYDVLSSGHIIARPSPPDRRALIIEREGDHREIPHSDVILNVCIDRMTDDLYVVTSDDENKTCVIDQVMSEGDMKKRRVASFPLSTRPGNRYNHLLGSRVMMTSSGNIIACDREDILIFKKLFVL